MRQEWSDQVRQLPANVEALAWMVNLQLQFGAARDVEEIVMTLLALRIRPWLRFGDNLRLASRRLVQEGARVGSAVGDESAEQLWPAAVFDGDVICQLDEAVDGWLLGSLLSSQVAND